MPALAPIRNRKPSEDGYMLLAVVFMMVLLALSLSVAAPRIAKSIQRDREMETMARGKQYIRAIQLYYRQFQAYPPNMDALVKTNNVRFLRQKYIDPLTGKPDWKPILFGQNKAPLAMGFFGQPLGGVGGAMPMAGIGPGGGNMPPGNGLGAPGGSTFGGSSFGGSSMGGGMGSSLGGGMGSSLGGGLGSSPGGSTFGSTNSGTAPTAGGSPTTGSPTTGGDSSGSSTAGDGSGGAGASGSSSGGTGFMSGQNGQTFGGGGIIGVEPVLAKPSLLIYKKMTHYNQWEFTYSPMQDMMKQMAAGGIAAPPGGGTAQPGTPGFGSPGGSGGSSGGLGGTSFGSPGGSSFGGSSGGSFGGSSGGFGSSPSPSQPTQPQQ